MKTTVLRKSLFAFLRAALPVLLLFALVLHTGAEAFSFDCEDDCEEACTGDCACLHSRSIVSALPSVSPEWQLSDCHRSSLPIPSPRAVEQEWFDAIDHPPQILH